MKVIDKLSTREQIELFLIQARWFAKRPICWIKGHYTSTEKIDNELGSVQVFGGFITSDGKHRCLRCNMGFEKRIYKAN
jgi:hypothetical protein